MGEFLFDGEIVTTLIWLNRF